MSRTRLLRYLAATVGSIIALGCADYATSPNTSIQPPSITVSQRNLDRGTLVRAVRWSSGRQASSLEASGVIGREGGILSIPDADFTIVFPRGALAQATNITIVANSDGFVGYEMLPHGLTFARPVIATQGLGRVARSEGVFCAYLPAGEAIGANGTVRALEIATSTTKYGVQVAGLAQASVQAWTLNHFSRYILASGASDSTATAPQ